VFVVLLIWSGTICTETTADSMDTGQYTVAYLEILRQATDRDDRTAALV
jgi:hypothetical protein